MKIQQCTQCKEPSIPGMVQGHGKCKYHYCVGVWGKSWADTVFLTDKKNEQSHAN